MKYQKEIPSACYDEWNLSFVSSSLHPQTAIFLFTPKYRRKIIYNQYKESIRDILRQLCAYKGVEILEWHLMTDRAYVGKHSAET